MNPKLRPCTAAELAALNVKEMTSRCYHHEIAGHLAAIAAMGDDHAKINHYCIQVLMLLDAQEARDSERPMRMGL